MRALEQWSFDEAVEAHQVLDALERVEEEVRADEQARAEERQGRR
jgi:hypothetical protein